VDLPVALPQAITTWKASEMSLTSYPAYHAVNVLEIAAIIFCLEEFVQDITTVFEYLQGSRTTVDLEC
jgi:hypothetical protein